MEWSRAPLFMSALSVSAFAQIHRESDLLLLFKRGEENKMQDWRILFSSLSIFAPCLYSLIFHIKLCCSSCTHSSYGYGNANAMAQ